MDNIKLLKNLEATGPNNIPTEILTEVKETLSELLANLTDLSFKTGVFPNVIRIAKAIPLYKKDNNLECNNYRPNYLLSNIGKLMKNYFIKE